jgi:hypothetical protein
VLDGATFTQRRGTLKVLVGPTAAARAPCSQCFIYLIPRTGAGMLTATEHPQEPARTLRLTASSGDDLLDFNLFDT